MSTSFKLTLKDSGHTRRLSFESSPTWDILSSRIGLYFSIPAEKVAATYIDSEEDQVTLSSQEELLDFYQTGYTPGETIKFTVEDLRIPRRAVKSSPATPRAQRNTFGGSLSEGLPFNIDEDWQHFPAAGLGGLFSANGGTGLTDTDSSLHAFVEEVESSASTVQQGDEETTSISSDNASTVLPPKVDKGKGKADDVSANDDAFYEDDGASTASLLEAKTFEKPEIHVYDAANVKNRSRKSSVVPSGRSTPKAHVQDPDVIPASISAATSIPSRPISIARTSESIPPSSIPVLPSERPSAPPSAKVMPEEAEDSVVEPEDPPLPPLDATSLNPNIGQINPSLSTDVANLLRTLSAAIDSHPELSEGFRNILQNAAAGTYWNTNGTAQRDSMISLARSVSEELSRAEQEAGRRVSEALGVLFRTISQAIGAVPNPPTVTAATGPSSQSRPHTPTPGSHGASAWPFGPWGGGRRGMGTFVGGPPFGMPPHPPPGPPPPPPHGNGNGRRGSRHHSFGGPFGGLGYWGYGPYGPHSSSADVPLPSPPPPVPAEANAAQRPDRQTHQSTSDLRSQVEAAKLLYRAEKERYRRNREERRREKEEKARRMMELMMGDLSFERAQGVTGALSTPQAAAPAASNVGPSGVNVGLSTSTPERPGPRLERRSQIVSNARGSFPQFEMIGVSSVSGPSGPTPRRSNTLPVHVHAQHGPGRHGRGLRRHSGLVSNPPVGMEMDERSTRAVHRIGRKLADMGFTETAHPDLPSKIRANVDSQAQNGDGPLSLDKEDDIITNLLEELVIRTRTPAANAAGPSGAGGRAGPSAGSPFMRFKQ